MATKPAGSSAYGAIINTRKLINDEPAYRGSTVIDTPDADYTVDELIALINEGVAEATVTTSDSTGLATRTETLQGVILTFSNLVGGSNYITGTYTNKVLTGGTGTGARATLTVNKANGIVALDTLVAGSGYTPGTYTAQALTGGAGTGATATIVVGGGGTVTSVTLVASGTNYDDNDVLSASIPGGSNFAISVNGTKGAVSAITLTHGGTAYDVNETLTTANTNLGGAGSGFSVKVATTTGPVNA